MADDECHVDKIPDSLLVEIFLRIPKKASKERVKLERVSKRWNRVAKQGAWRDFRSFIATGWTQLDKVSHTLTRGGPYVQHLILRSTDKFNPQLFIQMCPKVRHLCLRAVVLDKQTVECIGQTLRWTLKSLQLENCLKNSSVIHTLNGLFATCRHLEYLYINEDSEQFTQSCDGISLPPQLRFLALYDGDRYIQRLLTEANCRAVAHTLRGLRLSQRAHPGPFPHLGLLKHLSYLGIELTDANEDSFLDALEQLPELKALDMRGASCRIMTELGTRCPQLEHLTSWSRGKGQLTRFSARTFDRLVSLSLRDLILDAAEIVELAERAQLEYLVYDGDALPYDVEKFPSHLLMRIVKQCKRLRVLRLPYYILGPSNSMIKRAAEEVRKEWEKEEEDAGRKDAVPKLFIHLEGHYGSGFSCFDARLPPLHNVVVDRGGSKIPDSHVLAREQHKWLSAGAPKWAVTNLNAGDMHLNSRY